ncbi:NADP-dependent oxidoreductase domain-containing protein [Paraphysoderma sedebokerense]|nr:NADP-dependent oxidoreductase domain-containing protein [Paraphysoderma sedebokerense]
MIGEIGEVLAEWFKDPNHKREEYFFTSKLWNTHHWPEQVSQAIDRSLKDLQVKYLDLYLVHWPLAFQPGGDLFPAGKDGHVHLDEQKPDLKQTWKEMEKIYDSGKAKAVGVSNWSLTLLKEMLGFARVKPAVLQIELHPYLPQRETVKFCRDNNIVVTAYAPLGAGQEPRLMDDPVVKEVAEKYKKTPAQVLISYHVQNNVVTIPKSVHAERIRSNLQTYVMDQSDWEKLDSLKKGKKTVRYYSPLKFFGYKIFDDEE